jgi:hypothetical protein
MFTNAIARIAYSRAGFLVLALVAVVAAIGTYVAAPRGSARNQPHEALQPVRTPSAVESPFGPAPNAVGFARVLVSTSNAFAAQHRNPSRLSNAHCVEASRGHYMCVYRVSRSGRANGCHLVQAEWAREEASSFTVVLSGRVRRCGSVREGVRSLS